MHARQVCLTHAGLAAPELRLCWAQVTWEDAKRREALSEAEVREVALPEYVLESWVLPAILELQEVGVHPSGDTACLSMGANWAPKECHLQGGHRHCMQVPLVRHARAMAYCSTALCGRALLHRRLLI
jgi:hypothetical protein